MNMRDILRIAFVGAVAYGFYKLGEKQGQRKSSDSAPPPRKSNYSDIEDAEVVSEKTEVDHIMDIIDGLRNKPNKTSKDRDTIELLKIKLQQLLKGK